MVWCKTLSAVGSAFDNRSRGHKFESQLGHITFVEIDCEIISTGHSPLSADSKRAVKLLAKVCAQVLINSLED